MTGPHPWIGAAVCRLVGHRWRWKIRNDWPFHECQRCQARWSLGRPIPKDFSDFQSAVHEKVRSGPTTAMQVWELAAERYPTMTARQLMWLAEQVIGDLLAGDSVQLTSGSLGSGSPQQLEDPAALLQEWATWKSDSDVTFRSTSDE